MSLDIGKAVQESKAGGWFKTVNKAGTCFGSSGSVRVGFDGCGCSLFGVDRVLSSNPRGQLKELFCGFGVTKNRITRIAIQDTRFSALLTSSRVQREWLFRRTPLAVENSCHFSKVNPDLIILGGAMGDNRLDVEGVKALASMPSLDDEGA